MLVMVTLFTEGLGDLCYHYWDRASYSTQAAQGSSEAALPTEFVSRAEFQNSVIPAFLCLDG